MIPYPSSLLADIVKRLNFKSARITIDVTSVVFGLIGRANVEIGTGLNAVVLGYVISFLIKIFPTNFILEDRNDDVAE
jgi:hypothetical protein